VFPNLQPGLLSSHSGCRSSPPGAVLNESGEAILSTVQSESVISADTEPVFERCDLQCSSPPRTCVGARIPVRAGTGPRGPQITGLTVAISPIADYLF
jgi:hypothetical protein